MKRIYQRTVIGTFLIAIFLVACEDILEEQPRSIYTPDFFKTEKGVYGGLTSMYAHLRYIYGEAYYYNTLETGTDEYTYAQSADQNFKVMDITDQGTITSTSSRSDRLWSAAFPNINTASGIIENGSEVGVPDEPKPDSSVPSTTSYLFKLSVECLWTWVPGNWYSTQIP